MAPSAKAKKAAKGKTAAGNTAAAALSKADEAATKAVAPVADNRPKPEYDPPARPAPRSKVPAGSCPVTADQVLKATRALLRYLENQSASVTPKKPNLLDEGGEVGSHGIHSSDQVWLVVTTRKNLAGKKDLKPKAVKIPYPLLNPETTSALLLVKDPQRAYKDILLPSSPTIRKVLGVSKLRAKFKTFESLRQLRDTHDLILADDRIVPSLRTALGSSFLRHTIKIPIPVRIATNNGNPRSQEEIEKEVKKAVEAAYIHLAQTNSTNVRVGLVKHSADQLVENVITVINFMVTEKKVVKTGWKGVRGVYIKSGQSAALPLYLAPKLYDGAEDVITSKEKEEEAMKKKTATEERRKAKKARKRAAKKGISAASGAPETNGTNGVHAAEPAQKKRKANTEAQKEETAKEEVEGNPKPKKQRVVAVAKEKKPAAEEKPAALVEEKSETAPTTKADKPVQKGKSKSETAAVPEPVPEERREDAAPSESKAKVAKASKKAAKEAKAPEFEAPVGETVVKGKKEEPKEAEKPAAKAVGKRGKAAKMDKTQEENVEHKKEEPKRRSNRVSKA